MSAVERRVGAWIAIAGLLPVLLAVAGLMIAHVGERPGLLRMGLVATVVAAAGAAAWSFGRMGGVLLATTLNLILMLPEIGLRIVGFHHETGIDFATPERSFVRFRPDPELFYTMRPSREWVNQLGFLGDEIEIPKPSGVCRVLFLGDSVAAQEYDRRIERQLKSRASRPVDGVSLSMPGYSSHQGRIVVGRYADLVEPDVAVLSYGWNDHWLAFGAPDADKVVEQRDSALLRAIDVAFRAARVLQGTAILAERLSPEPQQHVTWGRKVRVPIDDYRRNLEWIGDFFVARGAPVILLTPPTSFYDRGVPDYYVEHGFAADAASAIALHRAYNQEVRELAVQRGWPLLDLERELEGSPELEWIFLDDGVHLTERGADELVRRIAEALRRDPPSAACLSGGS